MFDINAAIFKTRRKKNHSVLLQVHRNVLYVPEALLKIMLLFLQKKSRI